jgi:polysaccharide export outer membrane protein
VYLIDLSTIEGMKEADLQLQSNDIIYIEPTRNLADTVLVQISPILGLFTTILLSIALFNK